MTKSDIKFKDWEHQAREYKIGREKESRYLIWPMRSGKSKAVIDKGCYLYRHRKITAVVLIAPNGVHLNWSDIEIPKHAWDESNWHAFAWETTKRGDHEKIKEWEEFLAIRGGLRFFCINMDALRHLDSRRALKEFLATVGRNSKEKKKFMLAISEMHHFGRVSSKRTYFAASLGKAAAYRIAESGTPILNSPLKAFTQVEIIDPGYNLGFPTYTKFAEHFAEWEQKTYGRNGKLHWEVKEFKNLPELQQKLARYCSVVLRDDLKGMPPLLQTKRPVVMSDAQRTAYLEMVNMHMLEIEGREIDANEASTRMIKLQYIVNGYMFKDGETFDIDTNAPIYEALIEQIDGTLPGKSLVWCRFKEDIRRIRPHLKRAGYKWVEYHGNITSARERTNNRLCFLNDPQIQVCVGTPHCGGEGLDFSAAEAVIFFSSVPNALLVKQGEERGTVFHGNPVTVVRLTTPGTVDTRNWEIVDNNTMLSESIVGRGLRDLLLKTNV